MESISLRAIPTFRCEADLFLDEVRIEKNGLVFDFEILLEPVLYLHELLYSGLKGARYTHLKTKILQRKITLNPS